MVQVDLDLAQVIDLGQNMPKNKFEKLLREFSLDDYVKHHLKENGQDLGEDEDEDY